jgi:hypothetical protein
VQQDQACGGDVQRKSKKRRDQQNRGEHGEIQGVPGIETDEQDAEGGGDVGGQKNIQQKRGEGDDHQRQDTDQGNGHIDIGVFPKAAQLYCFDSSV